MSDRRFDSLATGLIPGLILPVASLLGFWIIRFDGSLGQFFSTFQGIGMLSKVLSLSVLPNLLLFFIFIWTRRNFSARGVIFATLVVAFVMLILKFA